MTAREGSRSDGDRRLPTSRRSFIALAGASAGVGLPAAPAGATDGDVENSVAIVASPTQRGPAREAVEGFRAGRSADRDDPAIALDVAETTAGLRRFTEGDVDVLAGSRPILPAERSRAAENGVDYERREVPTATATLRAPESSWTDCLRPASLAETWGGDGVVETWAEVDPRAEPDPDSGRQSREGPTDRTTGRGRRGRPTPPTGRGTALVRGVRSHQYASGFGGVGYYEPDRDWLEGPPDAIDPGADSYTPLVRLAFLYVDRASLRRGPAREFVRAYVGRSADCVGGVPYFGDPFGRDRR